eukprot:GILI01011435.1.p1 GENE.GILI01011435.1~~GILI01011435.1.p1  ORF type:complete len:155 (-),score=61.25 GILI01011435.1:302-733(-)
MAEETLRRVQAEQEQTRAIQAVRGELRNKRQEARALRETHLMAQWREGVRELVKGPLAQREALRQKLAAKKMAYDGLVVALSAEPPSIEALTQAIAEAEAQQVDPLDITRAQLQLKVLVAEDAARKAAGIPDPKDKGKKGAKK